MCISGSSFHSQTKLFRDLWNGINVSKYPAAEYWTLLPLSNMVHLLIERRDHPEKWQDITSAAGWVGRKALLHQLRGIARGRQLRSLTLIIARDHDDHAALSLLPDCTKFGQKNDVTVQSLILGRTTEEILAGFLSQTAAA